MCYEFVLDENFSVKLNKHAGIRVDSVGLKAAERLEEADAILEMLKGGGD